MEEKKRSKISKKISSIDCNICDQNFEGIKMLKKHIQDVHDGFKYHKCESCGKSFSEARNLMKHIQEFHAVQLKRGARVLHT